MNDFTNITNKYFSELKYSSQIFDIEIMKESCLDTNEERDKAIENISNDIKNEFDEYIKIDFLNELQVFSLCYLNELNKDMSFDEP